MRFSTLLLLSCMIPGVFCFAQSTTRQLTKTDSLTFRKNAKKKRLVSLTTGTQVKAKIRQSSMVKGHIHFLSRDSLIIITKSGLQSVAIKSLKHLKVFAGMFKQNMAGQLISKGSLIAVPASLALILGINASLSNGHFEREFYQSSAILGLPAAALIITGSLIRRKKLKMTQWLMLPIENQ